MTLFRLPRHRIGLFTISDRVAYWRRTGLDPYPLWLHGVASATEAAP